jgi:hypothetical protein
MTVTARDEPSGVERALHLAGERAPFAMLPRWLLYHQDVSEGAKFLYCVLHDLVQGRQGPTRPVTRAELAGSCGVSVDTIDRRLAQLVAVGAVEKQPQTRPGGQLPNIYFVWLLPPDGLQRDGAEPVDMRGRSFAAPVEGGANPQVDRSRGSAAPPPDQRAGPHPRGAPRRTDAAPNEKKEQEQIPPQPPRTAGGLDDRNETHASDGSRREAGTNPRARQTNPRAEAEGTEAARLNAEGAARRAELERATAARHAADLAAQLETERLEAEALALSAAVSDALLAEVIDVVSRGLAGPLARSPLALSRATVAWCRAAARRPGSLSDAVTGALAADLTVGEEEAAPPLALPAAEAGTLPLRQRIATLMKPAGGA